MNRSIWSRSGRADRAPHPSRSSRSFPSALHILSLAPLLLLAAAAIPAASGRAAPPAPDVVFPCTGISLTASYLAEAAPGRGPGFLFSIENRTGSEIRLAQPVPSSAHWYARVGDRWLWRASAGRGGALVNALRENGPMFAWRAHDPADPPAYLTVPAHGSKTWTEAMRDDPAIAYRPSCAHCNYPGEREYQAVFSYAYLPNADQKVPHLLRCGLRSAAVPMPPIALRTAAAAP